LTAITLRVDTLNVISPKQRTPQSRPSDAVRATEWLARQLAWERTFAEIRAAHDEERAA